MTRITLGDLAGLDGLLGAFSQVDPAEQQYLNRQEMYRTAISGRFGNVAWLRDDVTAAARLFNSKAKWSEAVNSPDYERLADKVFKHATKNLASRFGS